MSTISELTMLMNLEDRKRARLESREKQDARDDWTRFSAMATKKVNTAGGLAGLAQGEMDLGTLDELSEKIESTKTGVDYIDDLIDVRMDSVNLRKDTVIASNKIDDHLKELNAKLGTGVTVGAKESLDALEGQYKNIVSQKTAVRAREMDADITKTREHLELQLWKGEFDINKKEEGYQFPKWMGKHEQSFFTQTVLPGIRVAEGAGDYTSAISQLQDAFPTMRKEKTAYQTVGLRADQRAEVEAKKTATTELEYERTQKFGSVSSHLTSALDSYANLTIDNNDKDTQKVFYEGIASLGDFVTSMSGENLQNLDVLGAIRSIDRSIIINSVEDPEGLRSILPEYTMSDPLAKTMRQGIEEMIVRNTLKDDDGKITGYQARFGKRFVMFDLIEARRKLIEIYNTPGMMFKADETDTTIPPASKAVIDKLKSVDKY